MPWNADIAEEWLPCPICEEMTYCLKQYRYVTWFVFLGHAHVWQPVCYRACPSCMRRFIWRRCLLNLVPANLGWFGVLLPWALVLTVASFRYGHSRAIIEGVTPEMIAQRDLAEEELSWPRIMAIIAVLSCWIPFIGFPLCLLAWWLNRNSTRWCRRASKISLAISVTIHVAFVVVALSMAIAAVAFGWK